jgi:peptidoglycan/LPS O-acetylase OafA/YrhL
LGVIVYQLRPLAIRVSNATLGWMQAAAVTSIIATLHAGWNEALLLPAFALLVFSTQTDRGWLQEILTARPLVALGLWSYSIYLLHIPVIRAADVLAPRMQGPLKFMTLIVAVIALSALSYRILETPARNYLRGIVTRRPTAPRTA